MDVAIVALPGFQLLDLVGPIDVFCTANRQLGRIAYRLQLIAPTREVTTALKEMRIAPDLTIDSQMPALDTLLLAGGSRFQRDEPSRALISWLSAHFRGVRRLGSGCAGTLLLACGGLPGGRRVAARGAPAFQLARKYPETCVELDHVNLKDGQIYTSAGATAETDLALAFVEEDHGRGIAHRVARQLVILANCRDRKSQFGTYRAAQAEERAAIRDIQEWILDDLSRDLSVEALADRCGISVHTFSKVFKGETRTTPRRFVERARVAAARRMLEKPNISLTEVVHMCGFSDQSDLQRAFMRHLKIRPIEYQQRCCTTQPKLRQSWWF
ncbi:helix-turn-helix domain-containing protein [Paraburkholderia sp. PGU19]|uniref:GlxA family transcriptional regulator n=1 Tax=Paraburkholderia sp. PGU19 TaxID=2735434 RepID=UPI0015DB381F|nr:helix-turn-helix domain-containing protein [Paraburkholderia sp. PGU19]